MPEKPSENKKKSDQAVGERKPICFSATPDHANHVQLIAKLAAGSPAQPGPTRNLRIADRVAKPSATEGNGKKN